MTGLNEFCKFSFGGHIERETLEDGSRSRVRVSDARRRWDRYSISGKGSTDPAHPVHHFIYDGDIGTV